MREPTTETRSRLVAFLPPASLPASWAKAGAMPVASRAVVSAKLSGWRLSALRMVMCRYPDESNIGRLPGGLPPSLMGCCPLLTGFASR
ncbi:hypothetical protein G6F59_017797 [Rhizopus arrhizus]|nr:hypothetical protein G6F59_017797 [Rhizopus arrhizus]